MRPTILTLLTAAVLAAQTPDNPLLVHSTLFGGNRNDVASAVAVDRDGNTYVTGYTESKDFNAKPLPGSKPTAVRSAFVTKLGPDGKQILWSFLLGGDSNTQADAIAVDSTGSVWVTGATGARDFPLLNPVQPKQAGLNIVFLTKLSPDGQLQFSTYLGGERNDEANALAIDHAGNVYVGGRTNSEKFPLKNPLRSTYAGGEAFLAKFNSDGVLQWSTYVGGSGSEEILGVAIGSDDSAVYVTGNTYSTDIATKGAWIDKYIGVAGFAAKISANGDQLAWCTYIGARGGYSYSNGIDVDGNGNVYVSGSTTSKDFPTTDNALQKKYAGGLRDAYLLKLTPDGTHAAYLTYLGGSFPGKSDPDETADSVRVDSHGYVYVTGSTASSDLTRSRARQDNFGGLEDGWLARIDVDNSRLISATFWGGSKIDGLAGLALGPGENVTVVGQSASDDFPVQNPAQSGFGGNIDAAVARFCDPWLAASAGQLTFTYTLGMGTPDGQELTVFDGCTVAHTMTEAVASDNWVSVTPDRADMPDAKLKVSVNTDGLVAGEYHTAIRIKVPEAANRTLEVPVVLQVVEPPPATVEQN